MRLKEALRSKAAPWVAVVTGLILVLLVTPGAWTPVSRGRPSSFNDDPFGVSGFYRIAGRLGWKTERRTTSSLANIYPGTLVSIEPSEQLTPGETHTVLEQVRRGAGLLVNVDYPSAMADSLGILPSRRRAPLPIYPPRAGCRAVAANPLLMLREDVYVPVVNKARNSPMRDSAAENFFLLDSTLAVGRVVSPISPKGSLTDYGKKGMFDGDSIVAAARGIQYGLGRIVVLASPLPLRNDVMRHCTIDAAVPAIEALEYLANGRPSRLIFDEYRQGYGERGNIWGVLGEVFTTTAPGRGLLQLVAAGFIFLGAAAVRDVRPRARASIERRSPFEHVDALAAAYSRAGATTLATRRLMQGLRRRLPARASAGAKETDQEYLEHLAAADNAVAAATNSVRDALASRTTKDNLVVVGKSIEHIERSVKGE